MVSAIAELPANPPQKPLERRAGRITIDDAHEVARQVARGLTEAHAVALINRFTYMAWMKWKQRGKRTGKIDHLFTRMKALRVGNLVGEIEKAATGSQGVRHDWRAAQALAGVVDERFRLQQSASVTVNQSAITVQLGGDDALRRLIAEAARVALAGPAVLPLAPEPPRQLTDGQIVPSDKPVTNV